MFSPGESERENSADKEHGACRVQNSLNEIVPAPRYFPQQVTESPPGKGGEVPGETQCSFRKKVAPKKMGDFRTAEQADQNEALTQVRMDNSNK